MGQARRADEEAARTVWEKTEAEVQLGKALGPFDAWEIDEHLGALWVPAPRVGLPQRDSVRSIDDFSAFGQNSTSSTVESHAAGGVDEVSLSSRHSLQRRDQVLPLGLEVLGVTMFLR